MSDLFIGIDVGGTKIAAATLRDGELSESRLRETAVDDQERLLGQLVDAIEECRTEEARAVGIGVPLAGMEPQVPRISLTLPALGSARAAVLLITGEGKAEMVERVFGPEPDRSLPAAMVDLRYGTLTVLLDEAAASRL